MFDLIVLALLLLFIVIWLSYEYFERKTGVPTFPSMPSVRRKMIDLVRQDMDSKPKQRPYIIFDLGSGSGQLSWHMARALPEAQITGIELSLVPYMRSVVRQKVLGPSNLTYKRVDFWPYDVSAADAVVTYLPGSIMERVGSKLKKELKSGTLILANVFCLRAGWIPKETFELKTPFTTKLFKYRQK